LPTFRFADENSFCCAVMDAAARAMAQHVDARKSREERWNIEDSFELVRSSADQNINPAGVVPATNSHGARSRRTGHRTALPWVPCSVNGVNSAGEPPIERGAPWLGGSRFLSAPMSHEPVRDRSAERQKKPGHLSRLPLGVTPPSRGNRCTAGRFFRVILVSSRG